MRCVALKKVICNEGCQQEFILVQLGEERVKDDITSVGFTCPHCDKKYITFYLNDKIRDLQTEQRQLLAKSDSTKLTKLQLKGILQRIKTKKKQIKAEMDRVRALVEGGANAEG